MSTERIQRSLYKYVDINGTTAILKNGTLLFSSPLYFNDPFDISIQTLFAYDVFDYETFLDEFVEFAASKDLPACGNGTESSNKLLSTNATLSKAPTEYKKALRQSLSADNIWNKASVKASAKTMFYKIKTAFELSGIFCASKRMDNYLLWAHYADKHQGAVLEFVPNAEKDSMLLLAEDVEYSTQRPHLFESHRDYLFKTMFQGTNEVLSEYTKRITKTKSIEWAYEEEIRLYQPLLVNTINGERNRCLTYHDDELRSVYLGCKMPDEFKREIVDLAIKRNPCVKIYEMFADPIQYKLNTKNFI